MPFPSLRRTQILAQLGALAASKYGSRLRREARGRGQGRSERVVLLGAGAA